MLIYLVNEVTTKTLYMTDDLEETPGDFIPTNRIGRSLEESGRIWMNLKEFVRAKHCFG